MGSLDNDKSPLEHTFSTPGLLFINQAGPLTSKDDQTKVRKHVMKDIGKARRKRSRGAMPMSLSHREGAADRSTIVREVALLTRTSNSRSIVQQTPNDPRHLQTMAGVLRDYKPFDVGLNTVDPTGLYLIPSRGYVPRLLKHFQERFGMAIMPVDSKSMAYRLQTVWIERSLSDSCLLHATLYAASAHLDTSRGGPASRITLFHQAEIARHVQRRLARMDLATLDASIGSVIALAFFSYLDGNLESSKAHLDGLQKIIEVKGGLDRLGFDGLLAGLARLSFIIFAIVFDSDLVNSASIGLRMLPSRPPTGLISRIIQINAAKECRHKLPRYTRDILQDVYVITLYINKIKQYTSVNGILHNWRACQQDYIAGNTDAEALRVSLYHEDKLQRCAELAAILFFSLVDCNINLQWPTIARYGLVKDLQAALAETDDMMWLNSAPIAYSWVCLTGAAASEESKLRSWFYFRQGSMSRALNVDNASLIEDTWAHFQWLRNIARSLSVSLGNEP